MRKKVETEWVLSAIADGIPLSVIVEFREILNSYPGKPELIISPNGNLVFDTLPLKHAIIGSIGTIISYLLIEFLRHFDRKKIKICSICSKFFIANDVRRQLCYSKECEKKYQRLKKRKQRELEPEFYT